MKYKTIDLCAGIGGIRRGFEKTGHFVNELSAEVDEYAARTYQHNFGDNPRADLTSMEFKNKVARCNYDILLAGFPCQPFSSQGNQDGFNDPTKGTIFFHIKQIIAKTRPKVVFLENVQNIVSHDKGNTMHVILDSLEKKLNYKVIGIELSESGNFIYKHSSFVRNTKEFGLPQNRPRAYFIAFDRNLYGDLLELIHNELPKTLPDKLRNNQNLNKTVDDILENNVDIHYYMSATYLETLEKHAIRQKKNGNGYGYCIVNAPERKARIANTILATGGSGKERNLIIQDTPNFDPEDPVIKKKKGGLNNKDIRIMTPTEWGRLQGFIDYGFVNPITGADEFSFPENVPESQRYKQFGNSVSIPVIETMAEFIFDQLTILNTHYLEILKNVAIRDGYITRSSVCKNLNVKPERASYLLRKLVEAEEITVEKAGKNTKYFFK